MNAKSLTTPLALSICLLAGSLVEAGPKSPGNRSGRTAPDRTAGTSASGGETAGTAELADFSGGESTAGEASLTPVQFTTPAPLPPTSDTAGSAIGFRLTEPFGPLMRVERRNGDGAGYDSNYTNANVFVPIHTNPGREMIFWNAFLTALDEGDVIGNFGIGYRSLNPNTDRIFGASAWLDYDQQTGDYFRIGASFESMGRFLDVRGNSYFVFDDSTVAASGFTGDPRFAGNNIFLNTTTTTEYAMSGGDIEIGGFLPFIGRYGFNGYVGAYWLFSDEDETIGTSARLETLITENVTLNAQIQNDDLFGTTSWVGVTFTFPPGIPSQIFRAKSPQQRFADPVMRKYRVPVHFETSTSEVAATDPTTGAPIFIHYVDPDAATNGTGTIENPFSSLETARLANNAGVNIISVQNRADATSTNLTINGTFNLFDNQRLLGATANYQIATNEAGNVLFPALSTGADPFVQGTFAGNLVQLGNNTQVSNFILDGSGTGVNAGSTIFGSGVDNFVVTGNTLQNGIFGLTLDDAAGSSTTGTVSGNTATGNTTAGFNFLANSGGTLGVSGASSFANNTATGNGIGARFLATNGTINVNARDNNLSNNTNAAAGGALFSATGGSTINVTRFDGNTASNNAGNAVVFQTGAGGVNTINVSNFGGNVANDNGGAGVLIDNQSPTSSITAQIGSETLNPNQFAGNNTGVTIQNVGDTDVTIENSQIGVAGNGNTVGVNIVGTDSAAGAADLDVVIGGTTVEEANVFVENTTGVSANLTSNNGNNATPSVTVQNNAFSESVDAGVTIVANNGVAGVQTIDGNVFNGTGDLASPTGNAINVQGTGTASTIFQVTDNLVVNSDNANGISTVAGDTTTFTANISGNQILDGTGNGMVLLTQSQAAETVNIFDNIIQNRTGDGIQGNIFDTSNANWFIGTNGRNEISGSGGIGVNIQGGVGANDAFFATPDLRIENNLITDSTGGGIQLLANGPTTGLGDDPTTPLIDEVADIDALLVQGYVFRNALINNNELSNSGDFGINIDLQGASGNKELGVLNTVQVTNNIMDTQVNGIQVSVEGGFVTNRELFFANGPVNPGPPVTDSTPLPGNASGEDDVFLGNNGPVIAAQFYREDYRNTFTYQNAEVVVTGNTIRNSTGNGMEAAVGTNAYLALDVQNNIFSGTAATGDDFVTSSFLSGGNTNASVNRQGAGTFDSVFLDDTAQLSLRFIDNAGRSIDPSALGATYTNADVAKGANRPVYLFHVFNEGVDLTAQNSFIGAGGIAQDIDEAFRAGSYHVDQIDADGGLSYTLLDYNFGAIYPNAFEDDIFTPPFNNGVDEYLVDFPDADNTP